MGVFQRFTEIMSANVNDLLDRCEDPAKMIDQQLRELREDMAEAKTEAATVMAASKQCDAVVNDLRKRMTACETAAKNAVMAGDDEAAKIALQEKAEVQNKLLKAEQSAEVARDKAEKMKEMYSKLAKDVRDLDDRRANIKADLSMAKAQQRMANIGAAANARDTVSAFNRMEEKAQKMLAESSAALELNEPEDSADSVLDKYATATGPSVDAELAALKASLGQGGN